MTWSCRSRAIRVRSSSRAIRSWSRRPWAASRARDAWSTNVAPLARSAWSYGCRPDRATDHEDAAHPLAADEGQQHRRASGQHGGQGGVLDVLLGGRVDEHGLSGRQHRLGHGVMKGVPGAVEPIGSRPRGRRHRQLGPVLARHREDHEVGVRQWLHRLHQELRRTILGQGQQHPRQLCGRPEPLLSSATLLEQPGIVDRHARRRSQRGDQGLVVLGEAFVPGVGEVEVAEHCVTDPDRHAQEAVHGWVTRREPHSAGVVAEVVEPDRARVVDQRTQDPSAFRKVVDPPSLGLGHPHGDELLEAETVRREHSQGGVLSAHQLMHHLDDPVQHGPQVQVADDREVGLHQTTEAIVRRGAGAHQSGGLSSRVARTAACVRRSSPSLWSRVDT